MEYIEKIIADYQKTFKVTKEFDFVTNRGNAFKVKTYKLDGVYYVHFYRENATTKQLSYYQQNYSDLKSDFQRVVIANLHYINDWA